MVALDDVGRSASAMARYFWQSVGPFLGGDPTLIAYFISKGMSQIDAYYVADYAAVDKTVLKNLLDQGMAPYAALSQIYGGTYVPNVDANLVGSGFTPQSYALQEATKANAALPPPPPAATTTPPPGTATPPPAGTVTPPSDILSGIGIPSTIFGIPTLYVAAAAGLAFMLSR